MLKNIFDNYLLILLSFLPLGIVIGSSVSLLNIILIDITFFVILFIKKEFFFLNNKNFKYLCLLYLYLIFNTLISIDYYEGLFRNLGFLRIIIFFVALNFFFQNKILYKKVLSCWSIIISIILIDVYYESINGSNMVGYGEKIYGERIVSFFKDEPIVGGYLNAFFLIIIGFFFDKNKHKNKIFIFSLIFLIAILLTGERSNFIKAFLGLVIFYAFILKDDLKKFFLYLFAIAIFFLLILLNSDYLKLRYLKQIEIQFKKESLYLNLYKSGFEVFKDNFFFGVGNKNYRVATCVDKKKLGLENKSYLCQTHPHQVYIELLSEHGLIGTLLIIYIIFKIILSKIKIIINEKKFVQLGSFIFITIIFIPILPSGAFFSDFNLTLFAINLSILFASSKTTNIFISSDKK